MISDMILSCCSRSGCFEQERSMVPKCLARAVCGKVFWVLTRLWGVCFSNSSRRVFRLLSVISPVKSGSVSRGSDPQSMKEALWLALFFLG